MSKSARKRLERQRFKDRLSSLSISRRQRRAERVAAVERERHLTVALPAPKFEEITVDIVCETPIHVQQMNSAQLARFKADQEAKAAPRKKLRRNRVAWGLGEWLNRQAKERESETESTGHR